MRRRRRLQLRKARGTGTTSGTGAYGAPAATRAPVAPFTRAPTTMTSTVTPRGAPPGIDDRLRAEAAFQNDRVLRDEEEPREKFYHVFKICKRICQTKPSQSIAIRETTVVKSGKPLNGVRPLSRSKRALKKPYSLSFNRL